MTKKWFKGGLILLTLCFLSGWALQVDAWARVGGGRSMGSRGSRSMTPPRPYTAPTTPKPSQPSPGMTSPPRGVTPPPVSQPSSFWRSFGGGLLGGLVGGMLFRSLFGAPGAHGGTGGLGGSGISLLDLLLLAGIGYLIYRYIKKRRQEMAPAGTYYQTGGTVEMPPPLQYPPVYEQPPAAPVDADLERGLANIRQFDPYFDAAKFQDQCLDTFFKIQGAWANRDMAPVRPLLTDEMSRLLQEDADKLKAEKVINRLENIAVRSVDITEAWQEAGTDFITVRIYANLLDYNVDENTGQVLEGSKTDPVKFEEYWTFTRAVGSNAWQLSAINQAP
jgi:predicted lipid-binding transport protein (Tim44 family)